MKLDDILASLLPPQSEVKREGSLLFATSSIDGGDPLHIVGAVDGLPIGIDEAIRLASHILDLGRRTECSVILFLVDTSSQRMSRRDELLGLSEYLAHLAKSLLLAEARGHRTIGLLYGGSAAGAFIATALACGKLVALPGAHPEVMDLPSMARVTKLPLAVLEEKAKATPVFAPGLANLAQTGGIAEIWDPQRSLVEQLVLLLDVSSSGDDRGALGLARGGRGKAGDISGRVARGIQALG